MTQEMLIDLANQRYHADNYTPSQIDDLFRLEYDAWLSQQDPRSPDEIDAEMDATFAELYA